MTTFELAKIAYSGAVNPLGLLLSLSTCVRDENMNQNEFRESNDVKIILGQITFLMSETLGPSEQAIKIFRDKIGA